MDSLFPAVVGADGDDMDGVEIIVATTRKSHTTTKHTRPRAIKIKIEPGTEQQGVKEEMEKPAAKSDGEEDNSSAEEDGSATEEEECKIIVNPKKSRPKKKQHNQSASAKKKQKEK